MTIACLTACSDSSGSADSSRSASSSSYSETASTASESSGVAETTSSAQAASETETAKPDETTPISQTTDPTTTTGSSSESRKITAAATKSTSRPATSAAVTTTKQKSSQPTLPHHSAAAVYCAQDNEYIYKSNINTRISIASTTKLLTASLAVRYLSEDKVITVGNEIWFTKPDSTVAGLQIGQKLTTEQLLYGLLLPSGNDAAYTVAVNVARAANPQKTLTDSQAVSTFVSMMNSFALQLGMTSSRFANPEGWDNAMHYSTLSDLMILTSHALSQPLISKIVSTHSKSVQLVSGGYMTWTNTNQLIDPSSANYVPQAIGVKTGTTENAGCCLIAAVKHGTKTYYCAAMGCSTTDDRYTVVRRLLSYYLK